MDAWYLEALLALLMVAVAIEMALAYHSYLKKGSARRLARMLRRVGLDPAIMTRKEPEATAVVQEIWQRCRNCQAEGYCERWLDGKETGSNTFCPNVPAFRQLAHR